MKHECTSSNPYPAGKSPAKRRQSFLALLVLMIVWSTTGCTASVDHSAGDKAGDPTAEVGTQEPIFKPSPAASSTSTNRNDTKSSGEAASTETNVKTDQQEETQSEVESETPIETSPAPSGDRGEMRIADVRSQLIPLLPEGWHVMEDIHGVIPAVAAGDLNKDGIADVAAVIEGPSDATCECAPRSLLLAFGRPDKTLELSMISDEVVLTADEGGVYGDPFDGIVIERGTLLVKEYGGSNWRWYNQYRFRYQDKAWCLIGYTTGSYYTGTTEYEDADEDDYNLLTGDYILRRTNEEGKVITTKGNRGKKELVKLGEFDMTNM